MCSRSVVRMYKCEHFNVVIILKLRNHPDNSQYNRQILEKVYNLLIQKFITNHVFFKKKNQATC